jgi:hypothetical protein
LVETTDSACPLAQTRWSGRRNHTHEGTSGRGISLFPARQLYSWSVITMSGIFQVSDENTELATEMFKKYVELLEQMKKVGGHAGKEAERQLVIFGPIGQLLDAYEIGKGLAKAADEVSGDVKSELKDLADQAPYPGEGNEGVREAYAVRHALPLAIHKIISIDKGSVFGKWIESGGGSFYMKLIYMYKTHDYKMKPADAVSYLIDLAQKMGPE